LKLRANRFFVFYKSLSFEGIYFFSEYQITECKLYGVQVGFAHICLQPFFTHLMSFAFVKPGSKSANYWTVYQPEMVVVGVVGGGLGLKRSKQDKSD
jgi:hypothetical protein